MDLLRGQVEPNRRRMENDEAAEGDLSEQKEKEVEDQNDEKPKEEEETDEADEVADLAKYSSDSDSFSEIPPKPEDFVEPDQTLQDSKIEVTFPTEAPQATRAPPPMEPPPPIEEEPSFPKNDATMTDLAKQELGNWMEGGPKASGNTEQEEEEETETKAADENVDSGAIENEDDYTEPSEMEIIVPETEEEEEAIDNEIEEWEEEHGKEKPHEDEEENDDDVGEMDIPQTKEEEEKVNEAIEEWEEENGKPKSDAEVVIELPADSGTPDVDNAIEEEGNNESKDEEELIDTETTVPESLETVNPLVVSPSWTPPKIQPKHTLRPNAPPSPTVQPRQPSLAPVPMPTSNAFSTPTGGAMVTNPQGDQACAEYGPETAAYLLCKNNIAPMAGSIVGVGVPLLIILCCCWKNCCGRSKKEVNSRGEYRQIANTYGDASFDNAFSEDISDDEDDLEDASWGESNGRRVLEMRNMGRRKGDDDLSLEEMNG